MNIDQRQIPFSGAAVIRHTALLAIFIATLLMSSCSREASVWEEVHQHDTAGEYQRYLKAYPDGAHVAAASARLDELAWQEASAADSIVALQSYLTAYPSGAHKTDADARITVLQDAAWWQQLGSIEFKLAHANDSLSGGFQVGTSMRGLVSLDRNGGIAKFSPDTKLTINVRELRKSGKSAKGEYVFVAQFGKVGLFRSEKRGALVYVTSNLLVPIPTPQETERDRQINFRDKYDPTRLDMLSLLSTENQTNYDVFSAWKRIHLADLKRQIDNTAFDKVRSHIGILALIPLPGAQKWLDDTRFEKVRNAAAIAENRKKLLDAIAAAGSIHVSK